MRLSLAGHSLTVQSSALAALPFNLRLSCDTPTELHGLLALLDPFQSAPFMHSADGLWSPSLAWSR